jgi:ribosomal protein S18 acetylase RimI-like enzyme
MLDIITTVDSEASIQAHIENFTAFWSSYGVAPGGELGNTPELTSFVTGIPFPLFNGVLRAKLNPETVDTAVQAVVERFKERSIPAFWWVGPTTEPANLGDILSRHQFTFAGHTPGMAIDFQAVAWDKPLPAGLRIARVDDPQMLKTYLHTLATGSGIPAPLHDMLLKAEQGATPPPGAELRRYLGLLDGKPVATSAMVLHAGVAGIYAVATLPEARRRGIGGAMTMFPLLEAFEQGYRIGVLQASGMGFPVYQKLGFRTVFSFALYLSPA